MADPFRQIRPGEAVEAGNPIVSAKRNNVLTQVAKQEIGARLPTRGKRDDEPQHGFAFLTASLTGSDETASIENYLSVDGNQPSTPPDEAKNSNGLEGEAGDQVAVRKDGATWTLVAVVSQGSPGGGPGSGIETPHMIVTGERILADSEGYLQIANVIEYFDMNPLATEPLSAANPYALWGGEGAHYMIAPGSYADFDSSASYKKGDRVRWFDNDGYYVILEANQNRDPSATPFSLYWDEKDIVDYQVWDVAGFYGNNDYAKHTISGIQSAYKANQPPTPGTFVESEWDVAEYLDAPAYVAGNSYATGDLVKMPDPNGVSLQEYYWRATQSVTNGTFEDRIFAFTKVQLHRTTESGYRVVAVIDAGEPVPGVVQAYTTAVFDGTTDEFTTVGSLTAYPIDESLDVPKVDKSRTLTREHYFAFPVDEGCHVMWTRQRVVVITCDPYPDWNNYPL